MRRIFYLLAGSALLAVPAQAQTKPCATPGVAPLQPIMSTHTMPPYPELSVRMEEEGTTLLEVRIEPNGAISDAMVISSSGSPRLDSAASDHVKSEWRWQTPMKDCQPIPIRTRVSIKWSLRDAKEPEGPRIPIMTMNKADYPPDALLRHEQGATMLTLMVTETGDVNVRVAESSGFADLDTKAQELVKSRYRWRPATRDGQPVNTLMAVIAVWELEPSGSKPGR